MSGIRGAGIECRGDAERSWFENAFRPAHYGRRYGRLGAQDGHPASGTRTPRGAGYFFTETAKIADVVLPAAGFTEKIGTVTNLERRLQQINKAEEPIGESKPDWWIIQELARRMGVSMNYGGPADIIKEFRMFIVACLT